MEVSNNFVKKLKIIKNKHLYFNLIVVHLQPIYGDWSIKHLK